ncbi:hypothetical protein P170DRAFT_372839 [Aspergillus steynii IBT 23096]|uniref:AtmA protein n=1 Tax=Aspergillus steynii IBT 23096 TaxID=1392250 RepID=A0A2I2GMQ8_9EURO|nr:uncharacterized protein P170DRAFT_372839 [Aspergillus steynii IBT 23096]PLB54140.1 hypothetical protein P170DRAFT_372839 [Aspergillus steynii IBT 23096]
MAAKIVLLLLSISVFYTIFHFAEINGAQKLSLGAIDSKKLPGTNEPLRTVYTGVESIDGLLTVLTTFFWPLADASDPALFLHSIGFSGTFGSAWVLVTLESWRKGNSWTFAAFPMIFGLVAQVLTFAFATPLYCIIQLLTSATARKPSFETIKAPRAVLNALPFIFILGYVVPSALMTLPRSETITADLKQIFIAAWQPWPAYVAILSTVVHLVLSPFVADDQSADSGRATLRALRRVYAFAFANTAITHLISWVVTLATVISPAIVDGQYRELLHPLRVHEIPLPWATPLLQVETLAEGVHAFLRWDYLIGSAGVLVWSISLYKSAHLTAYGRVGWFGLVVKTVLLSVFAGPVGAAVELMWERDELVFNELGGLKKEVSKQKKSS